MKCDEAYLNDSRETRMLFPQECEVSSDVPVLGIKKLRRGKNIPKRRSQRV